MCFILSISFLFQVLVQQILVLFLRNNITKISMAKVNHKRNKTQKKGGWMVKIGLVGLVIVLIVGYIGYRKLYRPNVHVEQQEGQKYLYIHTGATFEQVLGMLDKCDCLCDMKSFEWMAVKMKYPNHIKPGKYLLKDGMTNRDLLNMLRSGTHVLCVDTVSYTHLTLPTICSVQISVVAVSLKKKYKNDK
eukprot:TRINITY_DN22821_c0_g2_i1.p3 TRINITY_DN22821_c0_g2~~TRINITY_DN22821_c0_g2_i1.p3  ORF type:complete len:190 (-),score=6.01 TRINITY_DN22821_c0_g2_i1:60-629(-)